MAKRSRPSPDEFALPDAPPPSEVSPLTARRFAAGRASSKLRRDEPGERLVLNVSPDLARRLRLRCAEDRCSLSHAAAEALESWLKAK